MSYDPFMLTLADGTHLVLRARDEKAARVVAFLAGKARLAPASPPLPPGTRHLVVGGEEQVAASPTGGTRYVSNVPVAEGDIVCVLEPSDAQRPRRRQPNEDGPGFVSEPLTEEEWFWQQLVRLSATIGRETLSKGGVLLHSGLAHTPPSHSLSSPAPSVGEREGKEQSRQERGVEGFLLAGRYAVGKSTASRRLPSPWRSLADDVTLIVRGEHNGEVMYWAHPWPTWSWFFSKEDYRPDGGVWDVQQAVPLRAIFILEQSAEDQAEPMGPAHTLCTLTELAAQTSRHLLRGLSMDEISAFNLQRFENLCALVQAVPAYLLHVSLDGSFWKEIEQVM